MALNYNDPNEPWRRYPTMGSAGDPEEPIGCRQVLMFVVILLSLILIFGLCSCTTTQYVPVVHHTSDTLIHVKHQRDSLYFCDSIYVIEKTKNDTVYLTKYKQQTRYIERLVHDTTYVSKTDSIPVPYEVIKEVPRQRTWLDKTLMGVGGMTLLALVIGIVVKLKKYLPF